jgi:hypothetical protein
MQNIGAPAGNGTIDTILVQAQGATGDHTDRAPAEAASLAAANQVTPPAINKAAKYDGSWKPV